MKRKKNFEWKVFFRGHSISEDQQSETVTLKRKIVEKSFSFLAIFYKSENEEEVR